MAKIKLEADPTFKAQVGIPVPGSKSPALVGFTFKHRTRSAVQAWAKEAAKLSEAQAIMALVSGWDFDDELTIENVERLCDNYQGAGEAIAEAYFAELSGARTKN